MKIIFECSDITDKEQAEIDVVLHRIDVSGMDGCWKRLPELIRVKGRLPGGRSGCDVLEIVVQDSKQERNNVVKLGSFKEIKKEFNAYMTHLREACNKFAPIRAATKGVFDERYAIDGEREAVVYDQAARFAGMPKTRPRTFENVAYEAITSGGDVLKKAIISLESLFRGIQNDLYENYELRENETSLLDFWNIQLGFDAVIEVSTLDESTASHKIVLCNDSTPNDVPIVYPLDLLRFSSRIDSELKAGDFIQIQELIVTWWENRLICESKDYPIRLEIISNGKLKIDSLKNRLLESMDIQICGRVKSIRAVEHKKRLIEGSKLKSDTDKELIGDGKIYVSDFFFSLPLILERNRLNRVTSLIHGDLNPRNILIVDNEPCLIDYAHTQSDATIFSDFVRLEVCLARAVMPEDFTWEDHVKLQRLLAVACRSGEHISRKITDLLSKKRPELTNAFQIFWTIRKSAKNAFPERYRDQWWVDYIEQLFLFAHLTLKWEEQSVHSLYATAAIAGVASEFICYRNIFSLWTFDDLLPVAKFIIQSPVKNRSQFTKQNIQQCIRNLSDVALGLNQQFPIVNKKIESIFETRRTQLVRALFQTTAYKILEILRKDHKVYISLKAYIDLKGHLSERKERQRISFDEMLSSDEMLAEIEKLRKGEGQHDVLQFLEYYPELVLIGDAGSGKSTIAREWEFGLASSIIENKKILPRIPIIVRASDIQKYLDNWKEDDCSSTTKVFVAVADNMFDIDPEYMVANPMALSSSLFSMELVRYNFIEECLNVGAIHLTIDALNELEEKQRQQLADWIVCFRQFYPRTPVLVCHRQYNYTPGLLPFPVITLQKIDLDSASNYIHNYLREYEVKDHEKIADALTKILLHDRDYEHVKDLMQTPLFLWMIVERYKETQKLPQSRGQLFEDFSKWYMEEKHHGKEGTIINVNDKVYSYDNKAMFLGIIGKEMVQRIKTEMPVEDIKLLLPNELMNHWEDLLSKIILTEMLIYSDGKIRFLHQSFQEYFAAWYFFKVEADKKGIVTQRILQHGWHDTFIILLGFAGEATTIVSEAIETALEVNPVLAARCLRIAEQPDKKLLDRFIKDQESILNNPQAGSYYHHRAALALFEYGKEAARAALFRLACNQKASTEARIEVLKRLAQLKNQVRFEMIANKIHQELEQHLEEILSQENPVEVKLAAIDVVTASKIVSLSPFLFELLQSNHWPLVKAAWEACRKLSLKLTPTLFSQFQDTSLKQLHQIEQKLSIPQYFEKRLRKYLEELNQERLYIIKQLNRIECLPVLLSRRFDIFLADEIKRRVNQIVKEYEDKNIPNAAKKAFALLKAPLQDQAAIQQWFNLSVNDDQLIANAAAHRIEELAKDIPEDMLAQLLEQKYAPHFNKVSRLVNASGNKCFSEPLSNLVETMLNEFSADDNYVLATIYLLVPLAHIDEKKAIQRIIQTQSILEEKHLTSLRPFWSMAVSAFKIPDNEEYFIQRLKNNNNNYFAIFSKEITFLLTANKIHNIYRNTHGSLTESCIESIEKIIKESQEDVLSILMVVIKKDINMLPEIITKANNMLKSQMKDLSECDKGDGRPIFTDSFRELDYIEFDHDDYGIHEEHEFALIVRGIGFLAREAIEQQHQEEAKMAEEYLENMYARISTSTERSIVVGLTTALGYLGKWEPILSHLGAEQPWMHEAAENIFQYWVPPIPDGRTERERAAQWIAEHVKTQNNLPPNVRSTLGRIQEKLEIEIGHHVLSEK